MNRRWLIGLATLLMVLLGDLRPCFAGKILFQTSVLNSSLVNTADGFQAKLQNNGLFYEWTGVSATAMNGRVSPTAQKPDLFSGSAAAGMNSFAIATFDNKKIIATQGYMIFSSIRSNNNLDKTGTMLTNKGNAVLSKFGTAVKNKAGDPVVEVANSTDSAIQLLSVTAMVNNSQDPMDLSTVFVPDGTLVPVAPSLSPNQRLDVGASLDFSFSDIGASNWSFEVTYLDSAGSLYDEIIAASVPEPASILLLVIGAVGAGLLTAAQRRT